MTKETSHEKANTVGFEALRLQEKNETHSPVDMQREIHKGTSSRRSFEEEIHATIQRALIDPNIQGDFYIVVLFKKERILKNVVRQYFFYRQSFPTPEYDQSVYKFHYK